MTVDRKHILRTLELPARYEPLERRLGDAVVKLLAPPDEELRTMKAVAHSVNKTSEGVFIPILGSTGAGKTTFADNVSFYAPELYAPTAIHKDPTITINGLEGAVSSARSRLKEDETRIIPINIDHRENSPPSQEEMSSIKRFLRTQTRGCPSVVLWPETDETTAEDMARRYTQIAGASPVELPLRFSGPPRDQWAGIAKETIDLCNDPSAELLLDLGVNPDTYKPEEFSTIGEFLRAIANDFAAMVTGLDESLNKPTHLIVLYVCESLDRGVLGELSQGRTAGLCDTHRLLQATPGSDEGKYWSDRRGSLVQTAFKLDARILSLPPAPVIALLRRYGPTEVQELFDTVGVKMQSPASLKDYLERSDLGNLLMGKGEFTYETRGKPAEDAQAAMQLLAGEFGYEHGKDKSLNKALLTGLVELLPLLGINLSASGAEQQLDYAKLIPDVHLVIDGHVYCIEFVWRSGEALATGRRSEVAKYALRKLKNYASKMGWVPV